MGKNSVTLIACNDNFHFCSYRLFGIILLHCLIKVWYICVMLHLSFKTMHLLLLACFVKKIVKANGPLVWLPAWNISLNVSGDTVHTQGSSLRAVCDFHQAVPSTGYVPSFRWRLGDHDIRSSASRQVVVVVKDYHSQSVLSVDTLRLGDNGR